MGSSDVAIPDPVVGAGTEANYVGTGANAGQVRVRVSCIRILPAQNFVSSGDFMQITYDAP